MSLISLTMHYYVHCTEVDIAACCPSSNILPCIMDFNKLPNMNMLQPRGNNMRIKMAG
jgi:hypothetical protein